MADFNIAIKKILHHEGGYVNNPNDPGGATNFGISLRFLKDHIEGDFNKDGVVNINDIKNMTIEQAALIYKVFWWDKYKYGKINDQTIATKIFDFSVNMGAKRAHILLQEALNNAFDLNLDVDGILGPTSIQTINIIKDGNEEQALLDAYSKTAWDFYRRLITNNPKLKVFERGWKNRAYSISTANSIK